MKIIIATNYQEILVSDSDYDLLNRHNWVVQNTGYASAPLGGRYINMHDIVIGTKQGAHVCDHINRNKLDNRRENLREVSVAMNNINRGKMKPTKRKLKSPYVGAFEKEQNGKIKYEAGISIKSKYFYIGRFNTPEEAAAVRDAFSYYVHGEQGYLNFPDRIEEYKTWLFPEHTIDRLKKRL